MENTVTIKENASNKVYLLLRPVILLAVVVLFIPAINPARISGLIGKNLSLFTSGMSYSALTVDFGRAFRKGWVDPSTLRLVSICSLIIIIGTVIMGVNGCLSLGNRKCRRLGNWFSIVGALIELGGLGGIYAAYNQMSASTKVSKVEPMFQSGFWMFFVIAVVIIVLSVVVQIMTPRTVKDEKFEMDSKYKLFLMMLPFLAIAFVFSYLPLWGWRYAFYNYKAGDSLTSENFVGFKWFTELFKNAATVRDIGRVLKNTLAMSGLGIATSWLAMAFAIFLSEIKNDKYRRFIQTFTTIPNFISWVLVYAIAFSIFSTDGFISSFLMKIGVWQEGVNMLMGGDHVWLKMLAWGIWKGLGWSAIIYIAAISGIDQQLYEAARVDGAGRFARMWHITVPGLIPTYFVLLLLSIANILSNGMEQYFVFKNATNQDAIQVLDLYIYQLGIVGKGAIPFTTVVGMVKSFVSVTLLFIANGFSRLVRGESIV